MKTKRILAFLLAASLAFTSMPAAARAETGTKPEDGTTKGQPFPAGTGGSQNFRIPGIVTLDDGTLVAACDARWNHGGDACGLDTIVSRSYDNGATWNYTFANYLGDNGNRYAANSTAFIDPAIATDGETVYMIADVWPGGYAINTAPNRPIAGQNGLDADGNLRLSDDNRSTYGYHLEKTNPESGSYYSIVENATGNPVDGYTIDAYYNITGSGIESNLFYSDSPYLVYPTDYLYLTSSTDGGATWSYPSLLNIKKESEQTLLVGPGRGIVTSKGRIIFTAYEFTDGDRNSCCFYSDDQGKTWVRGESVSSQSSEAAIVEADGKLYMFTRHGGYYVSSDWGQTWSDRIEPGISYCQSCELSAITYSKKIDGKTAIILSAPSATSRAAGKLFVGLVQEDGSLSWDYSYSVNGDAYYAYSCLTELNDGSIGLLYENAGTAITYTNPPVSAVASGAVISDIWCTDASGRITASVDMKSGSSAALQVISAKANAVLQAKSDNSLLKASLSGNTLTITSSSLAADFARGTVTVTDGTNTLAITVNVTDAAQYEIIELRMGDIYTISGYSGGEVLNPDTTVTKITANSDSIEIEALAEGTASVKVSGKTYFIVVKNDEKELKLKEGESITVPGAVILQNADKTVVSVTRNTVPYPYEPINGLPADGKYLIGTATHIVTEADSAVTDPLGRAMQPAYYDSEDLTDYLWDIQAADDGYTIQNADGQYLTFNNTSVILSGTEQKLAVKTKTGGFSISYGSYYLNNYGGSNVRAAGYASDDNTWRFYQPTENYNHTITGLAEGRTDVIISGITYHITVGDPLPIEVEKALETLTQKVSSAALLLAQADKYTHASVSKLQEAYNAAQAALAKPKEQTLTTVNTALSLLDAAMKLELKPAPDNNHTSDGQQTPEPPKADYPAVGSSYSDKNAAYKVTSSSAAGGTVSFVKPKKKSAKTVKIPATVKIKGLTYKVTAIENNACKNHKKLTQVTIGSNVQKIGKSAFEGCSKLQKITIQSGSLKTVGKKAIKNIQKKCSIRVPKKKIAAYKNLFKGKGFKSTMKVVKK